MNDLAKYIGLPFVEKGRTRAGVDCWGLVWMIYREEFGLDLESHTEDYATTRDRALMATLMHEESAGWPEVPLHEARAGDVLIIRVKGRPWHCGVVHEPPWFIHADRKAGTVRERWDSMLWQKRVGAIYRHAEMLIASTAR